MKAFLVECRKAHLSPAHLNALEALEVTDEAWVHKYRDGDLPAAVRANGYAQDMLGRMYLMGTSVPADRDKAIFWLQKAASQGYAPARELLPIALDRGTTPLPLPGAPKL